MPEILIRPEGPADGAAVRSVLVAAFPTSGEADLVESLRAAGRLTVALVAESAGQVVGQVAFSPVTLGELSGVLGLAPVAVSPEQQKQGVGSALIRAGLAACRAEGCPLVVVLGEPEYYHRFGFERALARGIANEYGVDEPFMALALTADAWPAATEVAPLLARYGGEFAALS